MLRSKSCGHKESLYLLLVANAATIINISNQHLEEKDIIISSKQADLITILTWNITKYYFIRHSLYDALVCCLLFKDNQNKINN